MPNSVLGLEFSFYPLLFPNKMQLWVNLTFTLSGPTQKDFLASVVSYGILHLLGLIDYVTENVSNTWSLFMTP